MPQKNKKKKTTEKTCQIFFFKCFYFFVVFIMYKNVICGPQQLCSSVLLLVILWYGLWLLVPPIHYWIYHWMAALVTERSVDRSLTCKYCSTALVLVLYMWRVVCGSILLVLLWLSWWGLTDDESGGFCLLRLGYIELSTLLLLEVYTK